MNIDNIPKEDGYYWVKINSHTMSSIYIPMKGFQVVQIFSSSAGSSSNKITRYVKFLEKDYGGRRYCRVQYFLERVKFTKFIEIFNPNMVNSNAN